MKLNISLPQMGREVSLTADNLIDASLVLGHGEILVETDTKNLIIFAMMKSGSSFVVNAISNILSYQIVTLSRQFSPDSFSEKIGDNDLSLCGRFNGNHTPEVTYMLLASPQHNSVSHQHAIADAPTLWAIKTFPSFIPVILQRNILDAVVSMNDDIMKYADREEKSWKTKNLMWGTHLFNYQPQEVWDRFFSLSFNERIEDIITFAVPWYFSFLASWRKAAELSVVKPLFLRYESLPGNDIEFLKPILEFAGETVSEDKMSASVRDARQDKEGSRLNVGENGRGKQLLTNHHIERICRIGEFFADERIIQEFVLDDFSS